MNASHKPLEQFELPQGRRIVVELLNSANARPGFIVCDFDMTRACLLKERLESRGHKITITAILLKAIAEAQVRYPESRTEMLLWGKTVTYNDIVAGFTVERQVDGEKTVFFGELESPQHKSLMEIGKVLKDYGSKPAEEIETVALQSKFARLPALLRRIIIAIGKWNPPLRLMCQRATFGLTTLGKYGVSTILAPCVCTSTFAIGTIEERPFVQNDTIQVRQMMTVSLCFDHKLLDLPTAGRFLNDVKMLMEGGLAEMKELPVDFAEQIATKTEAEKSIKSMAALPAGAARLAETGERTESALKPTKSLDEAA